MPQSGDRDRPASDVVEQAAKAVRLLARVGLVAYGLIHLVVLLVPAAGRSLPDTERQEPGLRADRSKRAVREGGAESRTRREVPRGATAPQAGRPGS